MEYQHESIKLHTFTYNIHNDLQSHSNTVITQVKKPAELILSYLSHKPSDFKVQAFKGYSLECSNKLKYLFKIRYNYNVTYKLNNRIQVARGSARESALRLTAVEAAFLRGP